MKFMMMIKSNAQAEAGDMPDEALLTDMGRFNEEMMKAGVLLAGEGLAPSSRGARVRLSGKTTSVVDGPFAEAKELVAGFWLITTGSLADAIGWAKRVPGNEGEIELRQLYELSDFPVDDAERPEGWREQEQRFRDDEAAASPPPRKPGTTRFMVMLKSDRGTESGELPGPKALSEMGALMAETAASGALLSGEGLKPSAKGARVRAHGERRTAIDGPFTESKEMIAGYSMIQVASKDEAITFAKRWLEIHVDVGGLAEGEIEIRPVFELEDFPVDAAEKPDGWRAREEQMRARLGQ